MPELDDERYVRELFAHLYGVHLRKVPESDHKTYDYELLHRHVAVAAVEVKRFANVPCSLASGGASVVGTGLVSKPDNSAGRIGAVLHAAYKQLESAAAPRVLVFVNDESFMDALDLQNALRGYLVYGNDEGGGQFRNPTGVRVAQGRIAREKFLIDLYVWINRYEGRFPRRVDGLPREPHGERGPFFTVTSETGYELARTYFGVPETPKPDVDPDEGVPTLYEMLRRQAMGK